jgi:GT2 family glycosyltransferase
MFEEENSLPAHISYAQAADIVCMVSSKKYPQLPTGMGYCMYMTRRAIDEVGVFDEEHFGRGYGEENDWCYRALRKGFIHVAADDVYIYHKGRASFQSLRDAAVIGARGYLEKTYPAEAAAQTRFLTANPLFAIQENIRDAFDMLDTAEPGAICAAQRLFPRRQPAARRRRVSCDGAGAEPDRRNSVLL